MKIFSIDLIFGGILLMAVGSMGGMFVSTFAVENPSLLPLVPFIGPVLLFGFAVFCLGIILEITSTKLPRLAKGKRREK